MDQDETISRWDELSAQADSQFMTYKLSAEEVASKFPVLTAPQLLEYAEAGYAPCVKHVRTGTYYFASREIKNWLHLNFVQYQKGHEVPQVFEIVNLDPLRCDQPPRRLEQLGDLLHFKEAHLPPAVYFLTLENEVVYVGQSVAIASRIWQHRKDGKRFDNVFYLAVPKHRLDDVERAFIRHLNPPLNNGTRDATPLRPYDEQLVAEFNGSAGLS